LGIPVALGCNRLVVIESRGVRHVIGARIDPAGQVRVRHQKRKVPEKPGTLVIVPLPAAAVEELRPGHWGRAFALFNPHAAVKIRKREEASDPGKTPAPVLGIFYQPTVEFPGGFRKFLASDKTSPWWYDEAALKRLIFLHIAAARSGGRDLTLRDFVRQFCGLTGHDEARQVCNHFPEVSRLSDFGGHEHLVARLLRGMCAVATAPSPGLLGTVGKAHFLQCFEDWYGVKRHWAKKVAGEVDGVPFVFEVVVAETERPGRLFHGVNFSPTFEDPLADECQTCDEFTSFGIEGFLEDAHANPRGRSAVPTAGAVHLIWPAPEFLDKGKTRLRVPQAMAAAIAETLWHVTKTLYHQEERHKENAARQAKADEKRERAEANAGKLPLTEAMPLILTEAVAHATGGNSPSPPTRCSTAFGRGSSPSPGRNWSPNISSRTSCPRTSVNTVRSCCPMADRPSTTSRAGHSTSRTPALRSRSAPGQERARVGGVAAVDGEVVVIAARAVYHDTHAGLLLRREGTAADRQELTPVALAGDAVVHDEQLQRRLRSR
jgi:hypothetical protein